MSERRSIPSNNDIVIEDVSLDVMNAEHLLHWATEVLAFEDSSVRVMPKADP
jgi:hypothetical protein